MNFDITMDKDIIGTKITQSKIRVFIFFFISRLFGLTVGVKVLEKEVNLSLTTKSRKMRKNKKPSLFL